MKSGLSNLKVLIARSEINRSVLKSFYRREKGERYLSTKAYLANKKYKISPNGESEKIFIFSVEFATKIEAITVQPRVEGGVGLQFKSVFKTSRRRFWGFFDICYKQYRVVEVPWEENKCT